MRSRLATCATAMVLTATGLSAQTVELTPTIGGIWNGSLDYTARGYTKADIGNAVTYGFTAGIYASSNIEVEFLWNRSSSDLMGTPLNGGPETRVFRLNMSQYFGNVLFHVGGQEDRMRPYVLVGMGATHFSPAGIDASGLTRPSFGFGGGVKYFFKKGIGLRVQWRWLPINMYTSSSNTWCGPVTGCWAMGTAHYLHALDFTTGAVFRF